MADVATFERRRRYLADSHSNALCSQHLRFAFLIFIVMRGENHNSHVNYSCTIVNLKIHCAFIYMVNSNCNNN